MSSFFRSTSSRSSHDFVVNTARHIPLGRSDLDTTHLHPNCECGSPEDRSNFSMLTEYERQYKRQPALRPSFLFKDASTSTTEDDHDGGDPAAATLETAPSPTKENSVGPPPREDDKSKIKPTSTTSSSTSVIKLQQRQSQSSSTSSKIPAAPSSTADTSTTNNKDKNKKAAPRTPIAVEQQKRHLHRPDESC